jgi:transposase
MGMAVAITRGELSARELREAAQRSGDGRLSCRLIALALALEGASRSEAARAGGMDRQTLRDWVLRYNEEGIAGVADRPRSGRPLVLTLEQMQELTPITLAGPNPAQHGVVRWRCIDLRGEIARRFSVQVHERTVGKLLHRCDPVRLQPRPYHPKKDAAAQEAFNRMRKTACPARGWFDSL